MKTILVTGGCGFIGTNFIHYLLKQKDIMVINLDSCTYAASGNNLISIKHNPRYYFVDCDIVDEFLSIKLDAIHEEFKLDTIVHFAAESHVDNSIKDPGEFIRTNIVGTYNLLNWVKNNIEVRFHHISTDEVYGSLMKDEKPFNEESRYDPKSPYSASKASSDHLVNSYINTYGIQATISNCSNNYGPYQFPEKVIPLFITNLMQNKKVPLYGDGSNIRDWIYVEDHCKAIDLILEKGEIGETYCIGGDCELSNLQLTYKILKTMNQGKQMIKYVDDRRGHDWRYAIDSSKIKKLGWKPIIEFNEGLRKTIDWYKENIKWWSDIKL